MPVGFIGLGNMGQGMADNLLTKGADLTVFTRTQSKIEAMIDKGAKGSTSVSDLTSKVDVVLVCLPDVKTSRDLLLGDDGVIKTMRPGQVAVDHSTVDIATSRACSEAAEAAGAHFLDAPISGGPGGAADGTLSIMVGGSDHAFEIAHEYFAKMGANVKLMGPSGAGTAMKLINQLLVGVNTVAAAEAFALANSAGVDIKVAADLLAVSWAGAQWSIGVRQSQQHETSNIPQPRCVTSTRTWVSSNNLQAMKAWHWTWRFKCNACLLK